MSLPRSERLPFSRVLSHLTVMAVVSAVLGVVVAGLAIPFAGLAGVGARNVSETMDSLPEALTTEALPQRTRILDSKGQQIATIYDENRVEVPLRQISRAMIKAVVAIEDFRYYEHGAIDLKGTLRAFVTNQANSGAVVQGGSSITQQLVKLTLINQAKTKEEQREAQNDTYARKFRELRYAIALEETYSKDWILERYLNTAYFGAGAHGIQAASRKYFNVNAKDLNLRQASLLAGLVKNPNGYDPTRNPEQAQKRRNIVLDRMAELNVVDPARVETIKGRGLGLDVQTTTNGCVESPAPFFCDYVIRYLLQDKSLGETRRERNQLLRAGGLTIKTTLDQKFQKAADNAVRAHVNPKDQAVGGLAMVEPGTGKVKAIAQSRPMGLKVKEGETYLNYAVSEKYGDANGFQGGSTFKPFVLAAAIEQGIPLNEVIDSPQSYTIQEEEFENCDGQPYGYGEWTMSNSTSSGRMNLYSGTRLSVNTFFAQLTARTGICKPYELAQQMGLELDNPTGDKNGNGAERVPSFTLGIPDVSPLEMAESYATFAARGLHCASTPVTGIEDENGNVLKKYKPRCKQLMEQSTADAVNDVLSGVLNGGFASAQNLGRDNAGKTGTTQEGKAVWFVGYTPTLATSAMIAGANAQGSPIRLVGQTIGGTYISSASGSGFAGPMWGDAMRGVLDLIDPSEFVYPSTVAGAGQTSAPAPPKRRPDRDRGGRGNGGGRGGGNGGGGGGGGRG